MVLRRSVCMRSVTVVDIAIFVCDPNIEVDVEPRPAWRWLCIRMGSWPVRNVERWWNWIHTGHRQRNSNELAKNAYRELVPDVVVAVAAVH